MNSPSQILLIQPVVIGVKVNLELKRVEETDIDILLSWFHGGYLPYLEEDIHAFLEDNKKVSPGFLERHWHGIFDFLAYDQREPIGTITLKEDNLKDRRMKMIINIVRQEYWGHHSLQNILCTILHYIFKELHFHKVYVLVAESDQKLLAFLKDNGFVEEGLLRHHFIFYKHINAAYVLAIFEDHSP